MKPKISLTVGDIGVLYDILCGIDDNKGSHSYAGHSSCRRRQIRELLRTTIADVNGTPVVMSKKVDKDAKS